jgi:hypothetical protein
MVELSEAYQKKGYWIEESGDYVLVWHRKNQIALLSMSSDIDREIEDTVARRIKELKDIEDKTGWKPEDRQQIEKHV